MRITCPFCGPRDRREFYYYGADAYLRRPGEGAAPEAWDEYLHLRDNPAGWTRDLWYHELGCSAWIEVERDTRTHEIRATRLIAGPGDVALPAATGDAASPARATKGAAAREGKSAKPASETATRRKSAAKTTDPTPRRKSARKPGEKSE